MQRFTGCVLAAAGYRSKCILTAYSTYGAERASHLPGPSAIPYKCTLRLLAAQCMVVGARCSPKTHTCMHASYQSRALHVPLHILVQAWYRQYSPAHVTQGPFIHHMSEVLWLTLTNSESQTPEPVTQEPYTPRPDHISRFREVPLRLWSHLDHRLVTFCWEAIVESTIPGGWSLLAKAVPLRVLSAQLWLHIVVSPHDIPYLQVKLKSKVLQQVIGPCPRC